MILVVFTLCAVIKIVAGRGVDTIVTGLPAYIIPVGDIVPEGKPETPAP